MRVFGGIGQYSGIPISRTLDFSKLPITRTKSRYPSLVKHYIFTLDFSNKFSFSLKVREIWILLYKVEIRK